ncbi:hypothetical protein FISHEDRAFT_62492 [Fistulina hepatica ATCC 64428]|nr:hypothetical protein FISHEDRAFT_62492 [Fistulina hepatica ATCC 64428]
MSRPYSIVLLIVCILILACGPVSLVNASDEHEGDCTGARMTNKMYPQKCHDAGGVGWENPSVPGSCHKPLTAAHNHADADAADTTHADAEGATPASNAIATMRLEIRHTAGENQRVSEVVVALNVKSRKTERRHVVDATRTMSWSTHIWSAPGKH